MEPSQETFSSWLKDVMQQLIEAKQGSEPEQTAAMRVDLLQDALARVHTGAHIPPETLATLHYELACALYEDRQRNRKQRIETAIVEVNAALSLFSSSPREHALYQWASIQTLLGNLYRDRIEGTRRDNLEEALRLYHQALDVFTRDTFPAEYANIQARMGEAYRYRIEGAKRDNIELAIACQHEALRIFTLDTFPYEHALTLTYLGSAYWERIVGEKRDNLELAIGYMHEALRVFTQDTFPHRHGDALNDLGLMYWYRVTGEKRDNLEQAIACFQQCLHVCTLEDDPHGYAIVYSNLGLLYRERIAGEKRDNLEQAIACGHEALRIFTLDTEPFDYALAQNNLGISYRNRLAGNKRDNLEQAISCYQEALHIFSLHTYPFYYALSSSNLGVAYRDRLAGERRDNLEHAITCFQEALQVYTRNAFPYAYARTQNHIGSVYRERLVGERDVNLEQAVASFHSALQVYTLEAFPLEYRRVQLEGAETQAQRRDWFAVHEAYHAAREAEDLLVALGTGIPGRDAILKEGHDAISHDGFALLRMGRIEEAAITVERGRARSLAEAIQFDAADPALIHNEQQRTRYTHARQAFIDAQATLHTGYAPEIDEETKRRNELERTAAYHEARAAFDAVVEDIRTRQGDFLNDTLSAHTLLRAAGQCGMGHALVYLAATPWGGYAIAVFAANPHLQTSPRFAALDLPRLTDAFVNELIESRLDDNIDHVISGFDYAQRGNAFDLLSHWPGTTLREKAASLHDACSGHRSTLNEATQALVNSVRDTESRADVINRSLQGLAILVNIPLDTLFESSIALLRGTLAHEVLRRELERCLPALSEAMLRPLVAWLREEGATSLTLIPCGTLAAFPLCAILLPDGRSVGETLPTSIAPNARSLLRTTQTHELRHGVYALGNPLPTRQELRWGEAEALTLAQVAAHSGVRSEAHIQWQATRESLLSALHNGLVVDASCHGIFDSSDFLRSRLTLANQKEFTLAELLSHQIDMRGLRLLILSACQTALLDLQGARDEVRSLATGMLQAGVTSVLASLWAVDDKATYLLMTRFAQEWFPHMHDEFPASALARAQHWLRTVTNRELHEWQAALPQFSLPQKEHSEHEDNNTSIASVAPAEQLAMVDTQQLVAVRGRNYRFDMMQAQDYVRDIAEEGMPDIRPYADAYYWAGFQLAGW